MGKFIPLSIPNLNGNEEKYVTNAIRQQWVSTGGAYIDQLEDSIGKYVKCPGAVACQSGTAGLHLSMIALGINSNHEVFAPTLTFIAAINPIKYVGATPIFMDCDDSLCIDPVKLREFCENQCVMIDNKLINTATKKQVKAVVVVHVFGNLADMEAIMDIGKEFNLKVIEDATEALGSYYLTGRYAKKHAGTIGDIGVYSFNGNKIITTGGGGMIVSNNKALLDRCKYLSTQAKDDMIYFVHNDIGYNYRMTNVQAAMGLGQIEQIEEFISTKKSNYETYSVTGLDLLPFKKEIRPNYWFYSVMTNKRDELIRLLAAEQIQTRPIWFLIHEQKPYADCVAFKIEKAKYYWERIVNIPCSSNLTKEDAKYVANTIINFLG